METLREIFDHQVQALVEKGYPEASGWELPTFKIYMGSLRKMLSQVTSVAIGDIPVLIVIPERVVSIPKQMRLAAENAGIALFLGSLRNAAEVETPHMPYLLCDVRIHEIREEALGQGRYGLTAQEGVSVLALFPQELALHRDYYLLGSQYDFEAWWTEGKTSDTPFLRRIVYGVAAYPPHGRLSTTLHGCHDPETEVGEPEGSLDRRWLTAGGRFSCMG